MKITKDNIEVILFDYAEGNLSPQEQKEVEAFLESNPQYKQMLAMYLENESVEKPLDIIFEEKDELFTLATGIKAKKALVIPPFAKWAASIAAGVALVLFVGYLFLDNQPQEQIAKSSIQTNNSAPSITTSNTESNETKKESAEIKKQSSETKNHFTKTKKEFYYSIEEENATINHQLAFKETELPSAEIEKQERILYMRYKESIVIKDKTKPSLADRIAKSIGLDEKIEEFYNSDFVYNTRKAINTVRNIGKRQVKTTTTTIKREESINV
ncbi:MAG: hypothetical protein J6Q96_03205 [Bacteroidales bacterium]|nr:hypothetical protein [Bacteroidales bacterium]